MTELVTRTHQRPRRFDQIGFDDVDLERGLGGDGCGLCGGGVDGLEQPGPGVGECGRGGDVDVDFGGDVLAGEFGVAVEAVEGGSGEVGGFGAVAFVEGVVGFVGEAGGEVSEGVAGCASECVEVVGWVFLEPFVDGGVCCVE